MKKNLEKLFDGSYEYFQHKQNFGQEVFRVDRDEETGDTVYQSEILSRVETGEFFKLLVHYTLNPYNIVQKVFVERSLGSRWAKEEYLVDSATQMLHYTFKTKETSHTIERHFNPKHFIVVPTFLTSGIFSLTKKIDLTARSPVTFLTTPNEWEFVSGPQDRILWFELKASNSEELSIGGAPMLCSKYIIFEEDSLSSSNKNSATLWISKNYGIPVQLDESQGTSIKAMKFKKLKQDVVI